MSRVTIRNMDPRVKEQVRLRAARHGRSMEAELRDIVAAAVREEGEPDLAQAIRTRFAPLGGVDLEPHPPVTPSAPPAFDP